MEYFEGQPLRSLEPRSPRAARVVEELLHVAFKQVFVDGFFHGDPHAGNILVGPDDRVCLIDWGLVGWLSAAERDDLLSLAIGVITNDADTIARVLLRMGTPTRRVNMADFKSDITRFRSSHLSVSTLGEADATRFVQDFVSAAQKYQVKLATEYSVMAKAVGTVEGIVRNLHPDVPILDIAREHLEPMVRSRYSPQKLLEEAMGGVTGLGSMVRHLPGQVDQLLHDLETGNFQVQAVSPQVKDLPPMLRRMTGRLSLAAFASSMTIAAAILFLGDPLEYRRIPILAIVATLVAMSGWTALLWWYFLNIGRPLRVSGILKFFRRGS
jgi:ubiquinone biosynthesis protein